MIRSTQLLLVLVVAGLSTVGLGSDRSQTTSPSGDTSGAMHPHEQVIRTYIRACNEADRNLLASVFTEDVRIYFIGLAPVLGREQAAKFWSDFNKTKHTQWTIDHMLTIGNEVVIEWSAIREIGEAGSPKIDRGSEWYVINDGKISEIRQYYDVRGQLPADQEYQLSEFPYRARGYSTKDNFMETLP